MSVVPTIPGGAAVVQPPDPPIFHAHLTPHRSLSGEGFAVLAIVLVGFALAGSLLLVANGFWPAALFVLGNLGFLLAALHLNRAERRRVEQVIVDRAGLAVRRFDRKQRLVSEERLPLYGLTLHHDHDPDFGLQGLKARVRQQHVELARDLHPSDRAEFAEALVEAMRLAGCAPRERVSLRPALVQEA